MNTSDYLLLLVGMGAVTYLPRFAPLAALSGRTLPAWLRCWLEYVPPAILAALVVPELFSVGPAQQTSLLGPKVLAAAPTLLVGWRTRSLGSGVLTGMGCYWLLGNLF